MVKCPICQEEVENFIEHLLDSDECLNEIKVWVRKTKVTFKGMTDWLFNLIELTLDEIRRTRRG